MLGSTLTRLRVLLVAQAVVTAGLAFGGPFPADRWLPFVLGVAAGALLLAWFVGTGSDSARTMTLGFEALALVVGVSGAASGYYVPGTVIGLAVGLVLLAPAGRATAPSAPARPLPARLTPPPVVAARPAPPAFPPPGVLVAASRPLPPPPTAPPGFSGSVLPGS